jgi:hypothetical protein
MRLFYIVVVVMHTDDRLILGACRTLMLVRRYVETLFFQLCRILSPALDPLSSVTVFKCNPIPHLLCRRRKARLPKAGDAMVSIM